SSLFSSKCYHDRIYIHSFPTRRSSDLNGVQDVGKLADTHFESLVQPLRHDVFSMPHNPIVQCQTLIKLEFEYHFTSSAVANAIRSEEHTSELQSRENLVCRLLLEKKKK